MRLFAFATALLLTSLSQAADVNDVDSELNNRSGFLVIDTLVNRPVTNWRLSREFAIERVPQGREIRLIRLRPGDYQWDEISVPYFDLPHRLDLSDDKRWSFRIKPRSINYAGTLVVGEERSSDAVNVRYINRTSEVLELLREKYPIQAQRYELIYAGDQRDDFLDHLRAADADDE